MTMPKDILMVHDKKLQKIYGWGEPWLPCTYFRNVCLGKGKWKCTNEKFYDMIISEIFHFWELKWDLFAGFFNWEDLSRVLWGSASLFYLSIYLSVFLIGQKICARFLVRNFWSRKTEFIKYTWLLRFCLLLHIVCINFFCIFNLSLCKQITITKDIIVLYSKSLVLAAN